jgi:hypothetical protein
MWRRRCPSNRRCFVLAFGDLGQCEDRRTDDPMFTRPHRPFRAISLHVDARAAGAEKLCQFAREKPSSSGSRFIGGGRRDPRAKKISRDVIATHRGANFIAAGLRNPQPGAPLHPCDHAGLPGAVAFSSLRDLPDLDGLEEAGRRGKAHSRGGLRRRRGAAGRAGHNGQSRFHPSDGALGAGARRAPRALGITSDAAEKDAAEIDTDEEYMGVGPFEE